MFKRKILSEMLDWKASKSSKRKAIVIKGLRQVGKTFTAMEYARTLYENVIYINFKTEVSLKRVFDGDLDVDTLTIGLSAMRPDIRFIPGKTILVMDEVQECANARASIKPFMEDGRYDVICTGSLLGIKGYNKKKGSGVPTGYEHIVYMMPMDFEEFLWAKGIDDSVIDHIRGCFRDCRPVDEPIHSAMFRYFSEYICVGGLPHVVDTFVSTSDMNTVRMEQNDILEEYRDDFGKHLDEDEREMTDAVLLARINRVFDSIPSQLAKENKKFQYSLLSKNARGSEYQAAIQWLVDFGVAARCHNLNSLEMPLEGNKSDEAFKLYLQDSGLLVAMLEPGSAGRIMSGDLGIYKGAIYEEIVADGLVKMGRKLYYYRRDSGSEIDFIIGFRGKTTLVEVKAKRGSVTSADYILADKENYDVETCIKLGRTNVGHENGKLTLPYYMTFLLTEY